MDKTILGVFIGTVVIIGSLIWFGKPDANINSNSNPTIASHISNLIEAEETSFDFGNVSMAKGKVGHIFRFKNTGLEPIVINKMYTSCMCTEASLVIGPGPSSSSGQAKFGPFGMPGHGLAPSVKAVVELGQEAEVEVVFDPAAHGPAGVGKIQRVVTLENSAGSPMEFEFSAIVTP